MATYYTHYGTYSLDVQPSDWFGRWSTASSVWATRAKSGTEAGQVLEHTATSDGRRLLSWDAIDADADRDNVEIACRFRSSSITNFQNGLHVRASGVAGTEQSYFAITKGDRIAIWKYVNGVATELAEDPTVGAFKANTPYWFRFRVNGSTLQLRWWIDGQVEPTAWQLTVIDTDITAAGWVGTGAFTATGIRDFDYFAVATNGDTAPIYASPTTPVRATQVVTETLHQAADPALRSTQLVTETLHQGTPALRSTQLVVETLWNPTPPVFGRVTQAPLEALVQPTDLVARVTHTPLEALVQPTDLVAQVSQTALEILTPSTPPMILYREYKNFLRFTLDAVNYAWGTVAEYRSSQWHDDIIADWVQPTDSFRDDFGLIDEDRVQITISDPNGSFLPMVESLRGIEVTIELVTLRHKIAGIEEVTYLRKGTIDAVIRLPGAFRLEVVDIDQTYLEGEYPKKKYDTTDFPELYVDDVGRAVPVVVGTALKVPFAYAVHNAGAGPWVYYGPEDLGTPTILTAYRSGRIITAGEYTVGTATVNGTTYLTLTFTKEQLDFQGNPMPITADIQSSLSRNVATEMKRLLEGVGVTVDGSFSPAYADAEKMLVDIGYTEPRTLRSILFDLLLVARGHLYRTPAGAWALVQDQPQTTTYSFDEDANDMVEIREYRRSRRSKTVELEYYATDAKSLLDLKHIIRRDTGAATGTKRFVAPYLRDHEAADRLLSYLAAKEQNAAQAQATIHDVQIPLGTVMALSNSLLWSGEKTFIVPKITRAEDRNEVDLIEYVPSVYTYVAGTLPADAVVGYQPDYSLTPPAAPTDLAVTSFGTNLNEDGTAWAWAAVECRPPSVNWMNLYFSVVNPETGETYIQLGEISGDGTFRATVFAALRPNKPYKLYAWAVNRTNVEGLKAGPVDFTTPTYGIVPPAPSSITVAQGLGKIIRVTWPGVVIPNLKHYVLQRNSVTVATSKVTEFTDTNVLYGSSYTYQVKTVDTFDNESTWTVAAPITIARNIQEPDLTPDSVSSTQIIDLNVTNPKVGDSAISTGKIQVEAVTVRAHATAGGSVTVSSSTWTDLISLAFDSAGYAASILFTAFGFVPEQSNNEGRILRNGVDITGNIKLYEVRIGSSGDVGATASIVFRDASPPTGSNTYKIQAREVEYPGLGTTYSNRSIILDTAKV